MAESTIIHALTDKRAELAGAVSDLERRLQQARADLAHVDATLRLFDPAIKPTTIRPKGAAPNRSAHFEVGEIARRCREALRDGDANGVTAAEVAARAMADKGISQDNADRAQDFLKRMYWTLVRFRQEGTAVKIGQGQSARWTLPADKG